MALRHDPLPWRSRSRQLLRAVAGAIVLAVEKEKTPVRTAARDLFMSCFVRNGTTLGTGICRSVYAGVLHDLRDARRNRRFRDVHRLAGSYEQLEHLGVPKDACALARHDGESVADRVNRIVLEAAGPREEALDLDPDRFLLNPLDNSWWMQLENGEWVGPMSHAGLQSRLSQLGLPNAKGFLAQCGHFDTREPVFDASEDVVVRHGRSVFNSYRPGTVRPEPGVWPDIYATLVSVSNGDMEFLSFLLDWLAAPLQALVLRGEVQLNRTAIVLNGIEGSGKNTACEVMKVIYGPWNCVTLSQADIDGRFGAQLRHKLFVVFNEVMSSTNKSAETANKLKEWIADDVIPLEGKFRDGENVRNFGNGIFASNDDAPVIITQTDRRYTVKRATRKLPDDIAARVKADLQGPQRQVAAFFHFLLRRRVRMKVGEVFETEDRKAIQQATATSEDRFCRDIAEDGWIAVATPWKDEAPQHVIRVLHEGGFVPSSTLADVYAAYCKRHGLKACGPTKLAQALKRAIPETKPGTPRLGKDRVKTRGHWGIPLDVADRATDSPAGAGGNVVPFRADPSPRPPATWSAKVTP
jgi:hypothetical protein